MVAFSIVYSHYCARTNKKLHVNFFQRSNDRSKMSKRLTEEAEQYFEDFLSNVEDTDFSSFDGERSDTSSTKKDVLHHAMIETPVALPKVGSPSEEDGLVLPWLEWETTNDLQTSPCKTKAQVTVTPHCSVEVVICFLFLKCTLLKITFKWQGCFVK